MLATIIPSDMSPLVVGSGQTRQVIDQFFGCTGKKEIYFENNSCLDYLLLAKSSDLDIVCHVSGDHARLRFWALFPLQQDYVHCRLRVELLGNASFADVHIVGFAGNGAELDVEAGIVMPTGVKGIQGSLLEEQFLLGIPKKIRMLPLLDVHSPDVKASHGVKIEQLDSSGLFYMMAKGLSFGSAQHLVVDGVLQSIFSHFSQFDEHVLHQQKTTLLSELLVNTCL